MKLRNKKTGEYGKFMMCHDDDRYPFYIETTGGIRIYYSNFEEMLEEGWEAYVVPKEPLIKDKDEKAREVVRAFSEVIQEKKHILVIKLYERGIAEFSNGSCFWMRLPVSSETMNALEDRTYYTITELCGEEKE